MVKAWFDLNQFQSLLQVFLDERLEALRQPLQECVWDSAFAAGMCWRDVIRIDQARLLMKMHNAKANARFVQACTLRCVKRIRTRARRAGAVVINPSVSRLFDESLLKGGTLDLVATVQYILCSRTCPIDRPSR